MKIQMVYIICQGKSVVLKHGLDGRRPLSGKVQVLTPQAAADASRIILETSLRFRDVIPNLFVVDHEPKFKSEWLTARASCDNFMLRIAESAPDIPKA